MSEYQYYEFKTIDRALTKAEMVALRAISTRAVITSTSFTNHYEWGDLKADPLKLLAEYFDAFVYVTNWGTRDFHLRLPQKSVDFKKLRAMLPGKSVRARSSGKSLIVSFEAEVESDDWDDGDSWMGALISLRSDLLRGDLRCLYLGWLHCAENEEFSKDALEPPVPGGLAELSASLNSLIEYLAIDQDLVEVAVAASAPLHAGPSRKELVAWIRGLPEKDKDDLLLTAALNPSEQCRNELLQPFQLQNAPSTVSSTKRRTAGELLAAAHALAEERSRVQEAKRVADAARQKAKDAADRIEYLKQLAKRTNTVWEQVESYIQKRQPKDYDRAVILLTDLRDIAVHQGSGSEFQAALEKLRKNHAAKDPFLRRLNKASLYPRQFQPRIVTAIPGRQQRVELTSPESVKK